MNILSGELDDATITMMDKPRCGVKDKAGDDGFARMKRYTFQGNETTPQLPLYFQCQKIS